jgi:ATP-dependent RNA helicase RhlE
MSFRSLHIIDPILKALEQEGYKTPTPIQSQAIPVILSGRDFLGVAQTGTGKTAAFSIPIIQQLSLDKPQHKKRVVRSLIITPTRELAIQIDESLKAYGRHTGLTSVVIFGGVKQGSQTNALRKGIDIVVGTPGRLLDLMQQGFLSLHHVEILVLDEADRMLDMGFVQDVKKILHEIPKQRQSLFFSATMPAPIVKLADAILHDPIKVEVTSLNSTVNLIQQSMYHVRKQNKIPLLVDLLEEKNIRNALVFTRTKHGADIVVRELGKRRIPAEAIHGNKSQNVRQRALTNFKQGKTRVLIATDIAARGIDIDDLQYVFNYEIPNIPETYVHRIGRTGRAGASGMAISFCSEDERSFVHDIERLIGKHIPIAQGYTSPEADKKPVKTGVFHQPLPEKEESGAAPVKKKVWHGRRRRR